MNTNQLKRFAKEARIKLLDQVGRKLEFVLSNKSKSFIDTYSEPLKSLNNKIKEIGKEQVIEMVSYTWFNRLMALRFMDANGYTVPKVVTPLPDMTNPEILQNALGGNIESDLNIDKKRVNELLDGKTKVKDVHTEVYKMLLIASCNQWHTIMPFMFERINDYTELLLPDDLLSEYSIVTDIRNGMNDEDCKQEELIGWLYQFYISDKKDEVFEKLKKNVKITAENIPAATQLFTPHWIVRYMVENTLGKLWMTLRPDSKLRDFMPYYIESPEGNAPAPVPEDLSSTTEQLPTKITFLDPCQGSGHVLVYAFELFTKIYEEDGFNTNDIPALILKNNLFGIDIDERASQLAAFALTMKARSCYNRFLRKPVQPNVIALENVSEDIIRRSVKLPVKIKGRKINNYSELSLHLLTKADNFGSLIQIDPEEVEIIKIDEGSIWQEEQEKLKEQTIYLSRQFHCVVTNPPYMGSGGINPTLKNFVETFYTKSKSDLMTCFMERCNYLITQNGFMGMINIPSWMFLSSFENLRKELITNSNLDTLLHFGRGVFGPDFGTVAFTVQKCKPFKKGVYRRLFVKQGIVDRLEQKEEWFLTKNFGYFTANQIDFINVPGSPISYWMSEKIKTIFALGQSLNKIAEPRQGIITGDNERFIRFFPEVSYKRIEFEASQNQLSPKKWYPLNKGGETRKWYGNHDYIINYEKDGFEIKNFKNKEGKLRSRPQNLSYFFREGVTWSLISISGFVVRLMPKDFIFNVAGITAFTDKDNINNILGVLNSKVGSNFLKFINPTINNNPGDVGGIPILKPHDKEKEKKINSLVDICVKISKDYWDTKEVSWDFPINELIKHKRTTIKSTFEVFQSLWSEKFLELHKIEEELNRQFIEIYGLQDELNPEAPLEEITILQEEAKIVNNELFINPVPVFIQLISYSIGCIFGRYGLDKPGLILANQGETLSDFLMEVPKPCFTPDEDNVIPVLEEEWFTDDIVGRFKVFLKTAFGEEYFLENLKFIEDTIGKDIRKYFVKDFYDDHIKRYKKRPIYWMFSSPKGNFRALIYMHRYQPDLCSKILNDYLRAFISKLEAKKDFDTKQIIRADISARDKLKSQKEIDKLEVMLKDCREYEETLKAIALEKISIDLDDGVKVNYQKFKEVLVPIKGLDKEEE